MYSCHVVTVGRGFKINFPVSSHDILKSPKTVRVRAVIIDGAITRLWMPMAKSTTKKMFIIIQFGSLIVRKSLGL